MTPRKTKARNTTRTRMKPKQSQKTRRQNQESSKTHLLTTRPSEFLCWTARTKIGSKKRYRKSITAWRSQRWRAVFRKWNRNSRSRQSLASNRLFNPEEIQWVKAPFWESDRLRNPWPSTNHLIKTNQAESWGRGISRLIIRIRRRKRRRLKCISRSLKNLKQNLLWPRDLETDPWDMLNSIRKANRLEKILPQEHKAPRTNRLRILNKRSTTTFWSTNLPKAPRTIAPNPRAKELKTPTKR